MISQKTYVGAGIILVKRTAGEADRYLLLKGRTTGVWSFSKGHPERDDDGSQLRTAVRETFEETGYSAGCDYEIMGGSIRFGKRPYWIGVVREDLPAISLSYAEHSEAAWLTWAEITALKSNSDVRAWIKKSRLPNGEFMRLSSCQLL